MRHGMMESRQSRQVSVTSGSGSSLLLPLSLPDRQIALVHAVLLGWRQAGTAIMINAAAGISHRTSLAEGDPAALTGVLAEDDVWVYAVADGGPLYKYYQFEPPMLLAGDQMFMTRNDSGQTISPSAKLYFTREKVSSLDWVELKRRTSFSD